MTLEDLVQHFPAQIKAINQYLSICPPGDIYPLSDTHGADIWMAGLESLQNEEPVERDRGLVDDVHALPDSPPSTRFVVTPPEVRSELWNLSEPRILTRSEYNEAEEEAMSANETGRDAFVVAGHPGMGKSGFLPWLLLRRLALGLPTILQTRKDYAIFFSQDGVFQLDDLSNPEDYIPLRFPPSCRHKRVWVLVDTDPSLPEPADIFRHPGTFFVVNATSGSDLCEWSDEVNTIWFYMKPWIFSEIIQARPFLRAGRHCTERQLWHLYNTFGASPRDLALYASDPATLERLVVNQIATMDPDDLLYASYNPRSTHHRIFTIWPWPANRYGYEKRIASRHILELLWDERLKFRFFDMGYMYTQYRASVASAADAGWIFESRVHQLLRSQPTVQLFPLIMGKLGSDDFIYKGFSWENPMDIQLPGSDENTLVKGGDFHANRYYRLVSTDFPGIDSLLLVCPPDGSPPILLIFRIMHTAEAHYVSEDTLRGFDNLGLPRDARKYYVVVVVAPGGVEPVVRVPAAYFGRRGRTKLHEKVLRVLTHWNVLFREYSDA